jgi:hypothetical protein
VSNQKNYNPQGKNDWLGKMEYYVLHYYYCCELAVSLPRLTAHCGWSLNQTPSTFSASMFLMFVAQGYDMENVFFPTCPCAANIRFLGWPDFFSELYNIPQLMHLGEKAPTRDPNTLNVTSNTK